MTRYILLKITLLLCFSAFAEEKKKPPFKKNNLALQVGAKRVFLKDELFAPLNFNGGLQNSLGLGLRFRKQNRGQDVFTFFASYHQTEIASEANDIFKAPLQQAHAVLSYHVCISNPFSRTRLYFGPRYDFDVNFLEHSINAGATAISLFAANSISPSILIQKNIRKKSSLDLEVSVPLYSRINRPPYSVFTDELGDASIAQLAFGGDFTGFKNYKTIKTNINLNLALSRSIDFITSYEFIVQRATLVKNYSLGSHSLRAGFNIKY